jgi:hypothetical protein
VRLSAGSLLIAGLWLVLGAAACSVDPGGSAGASPTATPTLNPNQLEALRRSAGATRPSEPTPGTTPASSVSTPPPQPSPSPYAPDLEAMLPSTVRDILLQRFSRPASMFEVGGDMCSLLCPGEPGRLAAAAGVPVTALTVAVAFPARDAGLQVGVIAIRFDGLDAKRSPVEVRIRAGGHTTPYEMDDLVARTTPLKVGSRTVTWVTWPAFYRDEQGEYLLSSANVLFIVAGLPPNKDGTIPADVRSMVDALP